MAQAALFLVDSKDKLTLLIGIKDYKLHSFAYVGDTLIINASPDIVTSGIKRFFCRITVGEKLIADGKISYTLIAFDDKKG